MPKLPALTGAELVSVLESLGFRIARRKGSHIRLISGDGRAATVPIHEEKILPKGLLRKIIREDLELSLAEFLRLSTKK
jgi:predicted RNA binding protein YcfA (HicA-like mRNA interferase family)